MTDYVTAYDPRARHDPELRALSPALALGIGADPDARVLAVDPGGRYWRLHLDGTRRRVHHPGRLMAAWYDSGYAYSIRHTDWPTLYALTDTADQASDTVGRSA